MIDFLKKLMPSKFSPVTTAELDSEDIIGDNLSFDGVEAFNFLRTNLSFSFSDDKKCHVIGISSPTPCAGKSVVSINLAYSMAKNNNKVLLIDCDLRLPTVASKLKLNRKPGLSNILAQGLDSASVIQRAYGMFDVLVAGDIPPRPSELLSSERMEKLLEELSSRYDTIILDSTPIMVVSDTLAMSKMYDGLVLVVHRDHDEKGVLRETLRQIEISQAHVLGFVFNSGKDSHVTSKDYKNKHYYEKPSKKEDSKKA